MRLLRDLRFAGRALGRAPLLCAAAVLTLGVGMGLATGVTAVAYGVLLRPLPYPDPERLVLVTLSRPGFEGRDNGIRAAEFEDWRTRLRSFEHLPAHSTADFTVRGAGEPRVVRGTMITDGFFETLGLTAAEGSTARIQRGAMTAAMSARLARQLGSSGPWRERGLAIGASDFGIAAVMPSSFAFPADDVDLWVRADAVPGITIFGSADQRPFRVIGRLAPGVSLAQARDDVSRVVADIDRVSTPKLKAREAAIVPLQDSLRAGARSTVVPFIAGAILVLVIACANVSGLLVGRAVAREREFAVRRAIGGTVSDVLRASLAEAVTVSLAGWALGLWIAHLVVRVFESAAAGAIHHLEGVRIDAPVVLASLVLALIVAALSGGAPALRALRTDPNGVLKVINGSIADRRLRLQLAAVFAALALALASIALWGAVAQNVLDRRHELAVRVAMGASSAAAVRLMLRGGLVLIVPGILVGAAGGAIAARALRHLLHGVSAADPGTFAAAGGIALAVSFLACYLPARRAARVSPAELLRDN